LKEIFFASIHCGPSAGVTIFANFFSPGAYKHQREIGETGDGENVYNKGRIGGARSGAIAHGIP
jgi:hypothetical protein